MTTKSKNGKITITIKDPHNALERLLQNYQSKDSPTSFVYDIAYELDDYSDYYDRSGSMYVNIENTTKEKK